MSGSEDESRTSAVGRKRNLPSEFYDQATTTAGGGTKQPRLGETSSVTSKESGEISDSGPESRQRSITSESPNGSIFERWGRRNVDIPLSGVARKPSVLGPAVESQSRRNHYFEDESSESGNSSATESSSSDNSESDEDESEEEDSDYEPPHSMASPDIAVKGAASEVKDDYPKPSTRKLKVKDLSEREQDLQYRYFFDVEDDDLVYCLCCGGRGHMRENCMERICQHCNALDKHASIGCPTYRKCTHCRQRGHDAPACTNVGKTSFVNDACDVCGETGHPEVECFLQFKPIKKSQAQEQAVEAESPPPARSWMMGMFDDARD